MSEETHTINVVYNVENIDQSIRNTQRLLYFTNALRLSILDIQQVMSGPTLSNVMWTAVQLTRVWTHLYRLITKTNQAQATGLGLSAARGLSGAALGSTISTSAGAGSVASQWSVSGAFGAGVTSSTARTGLWTVLSTLAMANPYLAAAAIITVGVSALGYRQFFMDRRMRMDRREFVTRQREIAKSQGYEY